MKTIWRYLLGAVLVCLVGYIGATWLYGGFDDAGWYDSRVNLPLSAKLLNVGKINMPDAFEFKVVKEQLYTVRIKFIEDEKFDHKTYNELLGFDPPNTRAPVIYHVRISTPLDQKTVFDKTISYPETSAGYKGRYAELSDIRLKTGKYKLDIKVEANVKLATLSEEIQVVRAYIGK